MSITKENKKNLINEFSKNVYRPIINKELMKTNNPKATLASDTLDMSNKLMNRPAVTVYSAANMVKVVIKLMNA